MRLLPRTSIAAVGLAISEIAFAQSAYEPPRQFESAPRAAQERAAPGWRVSDKLAAVQ